MSIFLSKTKSAQHSLRADVRKLGLQYSTAHQSHPARSVLIDRKEISYQLTKSAQHSLRADARKLGLQYSTAHQSHPKRSMITHAPSYYSVLITII